jgi:predicted dienelactone hydrolase
MPFPVSLTTLSLTDPSRRNWHSTAPRPLITDVWYPAAEDAPQEEILVGPPAAPLFKIGRGTRDAKLTMLQEKFPLVLLSHGTGGSAMSIGWFGMALARDGYIVAAVNHHGNTALEPYLVQGFAHVWERARDISKVITQLLKLPTFEARISSDQIGAAGFSLGGYTVIALAGGITDLQLLLERVKQRG